MKEATWERKKVFWRRVKIDVASSDPKNPLPEFLVGASIGGFLAYSFTQKSLYAIIGAVLGGVFSSLLVILNNESI